MDYRLFGRTGVKVSPLLLGCMMFGGQPGITAPIIGPRTMEQLVDNLGALEIKITAEDCSRLDAVAPPKQAIQPSGDPDFGPHLHRW